MGQARGRTTAHIEQVHRLFFEGAPEGILVVATTGKILAANPRAAELSGRPREALLGADLLGLFRAQDPVRQRLCPERLRRQPLESIQCDLPRPDGGAAAVEVAARLLDDGSTAVTLRPRAAMAERQDLGGTAPSPSHEEMRSILATIPYFVLRVGLDGVIQFVNRTDYGMTMDQVIGSHVTSWVAPEERAALQELLDAAALGKSGLLETRNGGVSGIRYVTRVGPVIENGRITSLIVVGEDVSSRKQAEEEVIRAGQRFQTVVEAAPIPLGLGDLDTISYLNPEFVRTFGYTRADVPTFADWWPLAYPDPAYREHVITEWQRRLEVARESGEAFEPMELEIRAKDGSERSVIAFATPLTGGSPWTHLVAFCDVTRSKQLEAERRKLEERLAHVQRMQSIGRLAGGVAHDNNNMLTVIMSHADLALRQLDPSHPAHRDLMAIREAAERSANLTKQLLAHARRQPIAPVVLDVGKTITRGAALLHRLLGEHVALTVRVAREGWPVRVDPTQLEQILTNLCLNARDAISGAGSIVVTTENVGWNEAEARAHGGSVPGDYVVLSVQDDGCGMSPEVLRHVFEPFFTTKGVGEGTGLGLATVHGVAEQNGGFVTVDSAPGRGATFRVHLPRYRAAQRTDQHAPSTMPAARPSTPPPGSVSDEGATISRGSGG